MHYLRAALVVAAPAAIAVACAHSGSSGAAACILCVQDSDCAAGSKCAQLGGDSYCASTCTSSSACPSDQTCTMASGANGEQLEVCVPNTNMCGGSSGTGGGATSSSSSSGNPNVCGSLDGPTVTASCTSCKTSGQTCQANGCYGGWWCNVDTNTCQAPPSPSSCPTSSSSSSSSSSSTSSGTTGSIGPNGGTISNLNFAIIGDTRPANEDDTANYPTAVITKIWQDVQAHNPPFAVTTGDYMFASPSGTQSVSQLQIYVQARNSYTGTVFPAMGNHECTGGTTSECGQGNPDGITNNYNAFVSALLSPLGKTLPYYTINVNGTNNAWTAKFVFVACNAWTSTQSTWLTGELAKPTTYTFVVRHEGSDAPTVPCVTPTATIMAEYPLTLLIAGHTHTYAYYASEKQLIVGNGGAPLSGSVNYGYVIAEQQSSGQIQFTSYDYSTNAAVQTFSVGP
jgi:Calcineurin-like phosphoesterase